MKILRLILLGGILVEILSVSPVQAQYARRYLPRRLPQMQPPQNRPAPVSTNAPAQSLSTTKPTPPPAPIIVTQVVYRAAPAPPVDPAKVKAAKEEATRRVVEFQKKRAEEGSESAQYELGVRYMKGDGVEKDEALARKYLTLSSKGGFHEADKRLEELNKASSPTPAAASDKSATVPATASKEQK